jgi:hypothetical protein
MNEMNDAPPKKKYTWLWIVLGIFGFLIVAGIGTGVFAVYWLGSHMEFVEAPAPEAAKTFDEVRARFPGQQPLLQFKDGEPVSISAIEGSSTARLTTLHILAFDDDEGRLVRVDVPFWLLRLKSGPIAFSSYASGLDDRRFRVRVEDIERRGPGIVLDVAEPNEGRVLIWAE